MTEKIGLYSAPCGPARVEYRAFHYLAFQYLAFQKIVLNCIIARLAVPLWPPDPGGFTPPTYAKTPI